MDSLLDAILSTMTAKERRELEKAQREWELQETKRVAAEKKKAAAKRAAAKARRESGDCLRAFTVHPGWAWAILEGVKTREWRTFLPNPREGICAITVSKSYSPSQWRNEAKFVREEFGVDLILYDELVSEWCGKVIAVCDYAAAEEDLDDNGFEYGWRLSNVRPLKRRIPCKGALKLWTMDKELSDRVLKSL